MAKKDEGPAYNYDISCDYIALEGIAETFKQLVANVNAGNLISASGSNIKTAGKWENKDEFVKAFRDFGLLINDDIEKLNKLADRMKRVAEIMREADETVNISS